MVDITDCCCEDKALKEQIKERALSSINKIYTTDARTYYPDGTGMVTVPLPTQAQLDQIETNKEDIAALNEEMDDINAKIQDGDAKLDAKIDAVDATLSEAIAVNVADITAVDKAVETLGDKVAATIPTEYRLYRTGEGKIQLQAETADGTLIDSNTLDMVIPYQYDLIAGSTDRSFKIRITLSNGTTYDTNDFIIPTPGDAPVEVTGIILTKDPDNVNRFKAGVNLSDGSMIETGYVTFIDSVEATVTENKLTVAVNDVESVPTNVVTSVAADYADSVLTVAVNGVSDSVTIESGGSESDISKTEGFINIISNRIKIVNEDSSDIIIPAGTATTNCLQMWLNGYQGSAIPSLIQSSTVPVPIKICGCYTNSISSKTSYIISDEFLANVIKQNISKLLEIRTSLTNGSIVLTAIAYITDSSLPSTATSGLPVASNDVITISYDIATKSITISDNFSMVTDKSSVTSTNSVYIVLATSSYKYEFIPETITVSSE